MIELALTLEVGGGRGGGGYREIHGDPFACVMEFEPIFVYPRNSFEFVAKSFP